MILTICDKTDGGVRAVCRVLELPRSSFYEAASETSQQASDRHIGALIEQIFNRHQGRYGYRRIVAELSDHAVVCSAERARRLMKERGLRAIQPKRFAPKTSDGKASRPAANLLKDQPMPERKNAVWTGDITYIPTVNGWLYLAVVIDLYSRRIVGWSLADHMRADLVAAAMENALQIRQPQPGLIFHSDRGSQYASGAFRSILKRSQIRQSMSAKANPYDNAWTESFMGTLKLELVQKESYKTEGQARLKIFEYIESYYNTQRKHSSIGYLSPSQFENSILTLN
jgi:transposase InsO family protein